MARFFFVAAVAVVIICVISRYCAKRPGHSGGSKPKLCILCLVPKENTDNHKLIKNQELIRKLRKEISNSEYQISDRASDIEAAKEEIMGTEEDKGEFIVLMCIELISKFDQIKGSPVIKGFIFIVDRDSDAATLTEKTKEQEPSYFIRTSDISDLITEIENLAKKNTKTLEK